MHFTHVECTPLWLMVHVSSQCKVYVSIQYCFPGGSAVKGTPAVQEMQVPPLGREGPLKKEMATHSSILAWKIPQTEEPGGLPSMGLQSQMQLSDFPLQPHEL